MKDNKKNAIFLLVIGILGIVITGYFVISTYFKAKNIGELLIPVSIGFIPFFISFVLLRLGIGKLLNKKK